MASRGGGRGRGGAAGANRGGKSSNYRDCDGQRSQGEVWEEELTFFFPNAGRGGFQQSFGPPAEILGE